MGWAAGPLKAEYGARVSKMAHSCGACCRLEASVLAYLGFFGGSLGLLTRW